MNENRVKQLQSALNKNNTEQAMDIVRELTFARLPLLVTEPEIKIISDYIIQVILESFDVVHNVPYIFRISEETKLYDIKEELKNATNINVNDQHWFHDLTRLTQDSDTIISSLSKIPEVLKFHVYVSKKPFLDSREKVPIYKAWTCEDCSSVNHANYTACIICNKLRDSDSC